MPSPESRETAYLRTYAWTIPTLSLGYFQRLAEVQRDPRWRSVPVVRRLTGGGAIWHHHELTYALILPARHPRARPNTALYRAVHSAIAEMLAEVGVPVGRRDEEAPLVRGRVRRSSASAIGIRKILCSRDLNSLAAHNAVETARSCNRVQSSWLARRSSPSTAAAAICRRCLDRATTGQGD